MQKWLMKAAIQGVISCLPGGQSFYNLFQKHLNRWDLSANRFEQKLRQCRRHLDCTRSACGRPAVPFSVLDLGTGCHPIIPVGMYLSGASKVWTIDIVPSLSCSRLRQVFDFYMHYNQTGRLMEFLPSIQQERMILLEELASSIDSATTAAEVLEHINIIPLIGDTREINLLENSVDFFISNCVLEHISSEILVGIFKKFRQLASPVSVMSHSVDMADHYADFDGSITAYNFLKYSERTWKWFNNPLHYQNRLRLPDYRNIHQQSGFKIIEEHTASGSPEDFDKIHLAPLYRDYTRDELMVTKVRFVSEAYECASDEPAFADSGQRSKI